jgi:alpha-tubulin suppressor-like RCC1 family protein
MKSSKHRNSSTGKSSHSSSSLETLPNSNRPSSTSLSLSSPSPIGKQPRLDVVDPKNNVHNYSHEMVTTKEENTDTVVVVGATPIVDGNRTDDNNCVANTAATTTTTTMSSSDIQTLQHDLEQVEEGLTQQRGILFDSSLETNALNSQQSGRAVFDSFGSALENIRTRLQDMMTMASSGSIDNNDHHDGNGSEPAGSITSSPNPNDQSSTETLNALSQRLSTAERAHSTRMPLNLLQQQQQQEESDSDHGSAGGPARFIALSPPIQQSMTRSTSSGGDLSQASSSNGGVGTGDTSYSDSAGSDSTVQRKRRRSSTLMASRRHADVHQRHDMELHEGTASTRALLPKSIPEELSEEMRKERDHHSDNELEEIALLLPESTREQLDQANCNLSIHGSYHNLSGSVRVLSQGKLTSIDHDQNAASSDPSNDDGVLPEIPPKDIAAYPPLYSWGNLTFQSSSYNSAPESFQLFGSLVSDKDQKDQTETMASVLKPTLLPPETRLGRSDIASMSISGTHMAFSTSSGRLLICGDNRAGAVDPSQRTVSSIPTPMHLELLAMNRVLKVSCGEDHTAALTETKSVLTWGSNQYGQLGHRIHPITSFVRPAAFAFPGRAADVACGDGYTMVLTTRMEVFFCGREEITGYNADEEPDEGGTGPLIRLPEQNTSLRGLPLIQIAPGSKHAVVVTSHGTAYALGCNEFGQCGRVFPKQLHVPVPISVPKTTHKAYGHGISTTSTALINWNVWKSGEPMAIADDVSVVHAACGKDHTVLVTKTGSLLVCGSNEQGQLGVRRDNESTSYATVQTVQHPIISRKYVSVEAGFQHTVLLDDVGCIWQMGNGTFSPEQVTFESAGTLFSGIAVGGSITFAIGKKENITCNGNKLQISTAPGVDELMEAIRLEKDEVKFVETQGNNLHPAEELARRTEELFRSPAVMNSLFVDPKEIDEFYRKLIQGGHTLDVQQKVVTAMEKGMIKGLESLRDARLMYPEAVRLLLLLLQCPLLRQNTEDSDKDSLQFDVRGNFLVMLCETMLGLPFEGYKALMAWTTTLYGKELFVKFLVKPLVLQVNRRIGKQRTYGIPVIAGVLRWLQNVAEQSDDVLAKSEDFHCAGIEELPIEVLFEDLARFRMSTKADRSVNFYLAAHAFLLSPTVKRNLLQVEQQLRMVQAAQTGGVSFNPATREFMFKPYFVLAIDRKYLLQQTLQAVANASPRELQKSLKVVFKGEDGVDAGGVTKEFFQLLIQKLFDINTGMWKVENQHEYWFNSDCTWNDDGFYLVGVLVGLALYNSVILDVHFPHVIYRKLLGKPLGLEDVVDVDVKNGLKHLLDYEGEDVEEIFCLSFEVTWMMLGQEYKKELKPDGARIPVTGANKEEYVMLYVKWLLVDSVEPQYVEFERGFMQVMDGSSLDLLRPKELELLVVGMPDLDFAALEETAKYEGGFDENDPVVKNLWRWVKSSSLDTQLKFLKFCTGSGKGTWSVFPCPLAYSMVAFH